MNPSFSCVSKIRMPLMAVAAIVLFVSIGEAQSLPSGSWTTLPAPSCSPKGKKFQTYLNAAAWIPSKQLGFAVGSCRQDPFQNAFFPLVYRVTPKSGGVPMPAYVNPAYSANILNAVSADSPTDVWAAGYSYNPCCEWVVNVQRFTGGAFQPISCPNPGNNQNIAYGVLAFAPDNVYIAGSYNGTTTSPKTYFAHWNGVSCMMITSPNPSADDNELYAIGGSSPQDIWLVGQYGNSAGYIPLCIHYDGTNFAQYTCPTGPGSYYRQELVSVSAIAGGYAWAAGYSTPDYAMFNGLNDSFSNGSWSFEDPAESTCFSDVTRTWGVAGVNPTFAWQVGECQGGCVIAFWNGHWNNFPCPVIPKVDYNVLLGVSAGDTHTALAAGSYNLSTQTGSGSMLPFIALYTDKGHEQ